jgi:SAM-dependent methyltransferase
MGRAPHGGSPSIALSDYWWYRVRTALLETILADFVPHDADVLDVGSADGPSVAWLAGRRKATVDIDPRGLTPGCGVCASAAALPFADESFDVVGAFDVIEHCDPESAVLGELARVLRPGGALLVSVPAYQWAWSTHDDLNGHHRRYTRGRALAAVSRTGLVPLRATYAFTSTFPIFATERLTRRVVRALTRADTAPADIARVPSLPTAVDRLLGALASLDVPMLRRWDLPFGSSVVIAARKPQDAEGRIRPRPTSAGSRA